MARCRRCRRYSGACICYKLAADHKRSQQRHNHPTVCGQHLPRSGGTCRATAPCGRDHSRY